MIFEGDATILGLNQVLSPRTGGSVLHTDDPQDHRTDRSNKSLFYPELFPLSFGKKINYCEDLKVLNPTSFVIGFALCVGFVCDRISLGISH